MGKVSADKMIKFVFCFFIAEFILRLIKYLFFSNFYALNSINRMNNIDIDFRP